MEAQVNPIEAKRLREAFKNTTLMDEKESSDCLVGDHVEIRASHNMGKSKRYLCIIKQGEVVADVEITNSILKRLKREWLMWNDTQSGMITSYRRHGLVGSGKPR